MSNPMAAAADPEMAAFMAKVQKAMPGMGGGGMGGMGGGGGGAGFSGASRFEEVDSDSDDDGPPPLAEMPPRSAVDDVD